MGEICGAVSSGGAGCVREAGHKGMHCALGWWDVKGARYEEQTIPPALERIAAAKRGYQAAIDGGELPENVVAEMRGRLLGMEHAEQIVAEAVKKHVGGAG